MNHCKKCAGEGTYCEACNGPWLVCDCFENELPATCTDCGETPLVKGGQARAASDLQDSADTIVALAILFALGAILLVALTVH